jgi:hypothetical protein
MKNVYPGFENKASGLSYIVYPDRLWLNPMADETPNNPGGLRICSGGMSLGKDMESNWLPMPENGSQYMVLRMYGPESSLADGRWQLPLPKTVTGLKGW